MLKVLGPRIARLAPMVALPAKVADAHYLTAAHRAWRRVVIARAGGRCQAPGCGATGLLYADHVVELKDGGAPLAPANGQALCAVHHGRKTADARASRMAERPGMRQARD